MNDAFGHPQSFVVLGGTSDIARELVTKLAAARGRSVVLAGRDADALGRAAAALHGSVPHVQTVAFDATATSTVDTTVARCLEAAAEPVDVVIVAIGELGEQDADEADPDRIDRMVTVNFTWPAAAIAAVAAHLKNQGHGRIVVLSSVAGCRIRRSNFLYGSAKAGLDGFARGLGESLRGTGVTVHTVRPGFVRTKMTAGRSPAPFAVGPEQVASDVVRGLRRGDAVIWSPGVLRWIFGILGLLPQSVWRRVPG